MLRIILSLSFIIISAFAQSCDFSNNNQKECDIDINHPPIFIHKFLNNKNEIYTEPAACVVNGKTKINDSDYVVIDCANVESKKGNLTEGIIFNNNSNLLKTRKVNIKQDNIYLLAAGDVVVDSGIRLNTENPKNIILEIIEGTNNKSNLILNRGAAVNLSAIIMPEGKNSNIKLNTFYGGIYEKDFIDMINSGSSAKRANMDTELNAEDILSLSNNGDTNPYSGNLFCGPEVNPLDLNNKTYLLKRIFSVKNSSKDKPNSSNSVCNVKEGGCFDNIVAFEDTKIDGDNYKMAVATQNLIPTYDVFIESGKINPKSNKSLKSMFPKATINEQNHGKCGESVEIAFDDSVKKQYLAELEKEKNANNATANNENAAPTEATTPPQTAESKEATTPTTEQNKEANTEVANANPEEATTKVESNVESKEAVTPAPAEATTKETPAETAAATPAQTMEPAIAPVPVESNKENEQKTPEAEKPAATPDNNAENAPTNNATTTMAATAILSPESNTENKNTTPAETNNAAPTEATTPPQTAESKEATTPTTEQNKEANTEVANANPEEATTKVESNVESKEAVTPAPAEATTKEAPAETAAATPAQTMEPAIAPVPVESNKENEQKTPEAEKPAATPDNNAENVNSGALLAQKLSNNAENDIKDKFLMVEKTAYDKFNKECYGDTKCLYDSLLPYDKVVWTKTSSSTKNYTIYLVNLSNNNLELQCEVSNYYGKNIKKSYKLSADNGNSIGKLNLVFPTSDNKAQITCQTDGIEKTSNIINVTPAKFDIKYNFNNYVDSVSTISAGDIKLALKPSSAALTLEGNIDKTFNGSLIANSNDVSFQEKNKCNDKDSNVSIKKDIKLNFKNGILQNKYVEISANTISFGTLNIDLKLDNDKFCRNGGLGIEPLCLKTNLTQNLSIVPANFRLTNSIISDNKISYYGQLDDRTSFKFNPVLNIKVEALNNENEPININKQCNYGQIQLNLKNNKLVEVKRSISDRLNSKVNVYLSDFTDDKGTDIKLFFGINKFTNKYNNIRTMGQNDLLEPQEVALNDFNFSLKFNNSGKIYDYNKLIVNNKNQDSVLIARGDLNVNNVNGDTNNPASLIAKYLIYCKSCNKKILSKYLQADPEIVSQYWYINTKHPTNFYLADEFIQISPANNVVIINSKKALEGRQQINFSSNTPGDYTATINQMTYAFPPYLNYSNSDKYTKKTFDIYIAKANEKVDNASDIIKDINNIKDSNKDAAKPAKKENSKKSSKPKDTKPLPKPTEKPTNSSVKLDIVS